MCQCVSVCEHAEWVMPCAVAPWRWHTLARAKSIGLLMAIAVYGSIHQGVRLHAVSKHMPLCLFHPDWLHMSFGWAGFPGLVLILLMHVWTWLCKQLYPCMSIDCCLQPVLCGRIPIVRAC